LRAENFELSAVTDPVKKRTNTKQIALVIPIAHHST
jgi:hypothetical protein